MPSLSPLDSPAGHPPSFGILCVGIERVVGVTAQRPLACQRSSKGAPMPIQARELPCPSLPSKGAPIPIPTIQSAPKPIPTFQSVPKPNLNWRAIGGSQSLMPEKLSTQAAIPASTLILTPSTFPFNPSSMRIYDLVPCYHCLPKLWPELTCACADVPWYDTVPIDTSIEGGEAKSAYIQYPQMRNIYILHPFRILSPINRLT